VLAQALALALAQVLAQQWSVDLAAQGQALVMGPEMGSQPAPSPPDAPSRN
jgi:hypothetical protein